MNLKPVLFFGICLLLISCLKREKVDLAENPDNAGHQTLRVEVVSCAPATDPHCNKTSPVFKATIALYESEQSFINQDEPVRHALTDETGRSIFSGLQGFRYFVVVFIDAHYTEELASIPIGGTGNLRIVFID